MYPTNLPAEDQFLHAVDEVLHYQWDPIGIAGEPGTRDEYRSYAKHVVQMLKDGALQHDVSDYLGMVSGELMRVGRNEMRDRKVTQAIFQWHLYFGLN